MSQAAATATRSIGTRVVWTGWATMAGGLLLLAGGAIPGTTWFTAGLSSLSLLLLLAGMVSLCTLGLPAGLILAGIAALRTRLWGGWHRFRPLIAGLFLVVVVFPSFALPGHDFEYVIAAWGLSFVLLGAAMRAEA